MQCRTNQWTADSFKSAVVSAARFESAKMVAMGAIPTEISFAELEAKVAREWLDYAVPAGNA